MKTIEAIIERAKDGGYSVYCIDQPFTGMGENAEVAKVNMMKQMELFKESAIEDGFEYPEFLNEPFEVIYKFDTESLLGYYSGILSLSGLERITGIHQKQLWSYLHGKSKPRKAQVEKIEIGLHRFGNELISISL
jgi:predicted RNase H-like HicB family nuclease